tara:strand:- start:117 stop:515 length:399 start_codon:yes stop_codon:yes gene_type:complete
MINRNKSSDAYKTIGEVTKDLGLVDKKTGNLQTHTIRYWETKFKQIKPDIRAGKRRYYSSKTYKVIEFVKFLLKDKGLTINGARKILDNSNTSSIDDDINKSINVTNTKAANKIKNRIKNISRLIKELKKIK